MRRTIAVSTLLGFLASWECEAFTVAPTGSRLSFDTTLSMARGPPRPRRGPPVKENRPTMNDEITQSELRVVIASSSGGKDEALGVMSRKDALARAQAEGGLDLILINDSSDPPVCKIVDYSKYRYMQEKKAKEIKKNSKASELKEVKMSYKIDIHDYSVRKKNAAKFLQQGDRVKCTVMFRGREVQHDNLGFELLDKMAEELSNLAAKEGRPKREGRNLSLILGPRPEVMKAISDGRRAEEKAKKKKKQEELEQRKAKKTENGEAAPTASQINLEEDDDDYDDDDDDDSLDALLGGDDLTKDLFN
uniref:Translation initiation factor IF-3 n=1 Tax=Amphora coffeiformis TaxID=265554 RepID=A0A7S3KWM0_9STRA|mmetsp:Transcript_10790/g.22078  ORF Transcript_10790/g.22078 Transcript_10790/m.22078 type:complete len:306 (-) Transcript_10790:43-960(-)